MIRLDAATAPALKLSPETKAARVYLDDTATVTHGGATVAYDAESGKTTFGGNIDLLTLKADGTATANIGGIVYDIIPAQRQGATKTTIEIATGAVVKNVVVNAPVEITGSGKIEKMEVHSDGVVIDKAVDVKPENITVDKDIKVDVGGKEYTGTGDKLPAETSTSSGSSSSGGGSGKSAGGTVSGVPTVSGTPTQNSITINAVTCTPDRRLGTPSARQTPQRQRPVGRTALHLLL